MHLLIQFLGGRSLFLEYDSPVTVGDLKDRIQRQEGLPTELQRIIFHSRDLPNCENITGEKSSSLSLRLSLRILGGKGGFGSLLRGQGAKAGAKKITNFDSCRDLNGRRIRYVNQEKKLKEWYENKGQREAEELEEKKSKKEEKEKMEMEKEIEFDETKYSSEIKSIQESTMEAVEKAIKKGKTKNDISVSQSKRSRLWKELDFDVLEEEIPETNEENDHSIEIKISSEDISKETTNTGNLTSETSEIDTQTTVSIDLSKYNSSEELESLGLQILKEELQRLGILCGGTLKERAQRLFSLKNSNTIDPKLLAKTNSKKRKR